MPMEYFEQRERALLGDRFDVLYAAPQETAERGVTVSALRSSPEQFAAKADFPLEASPFCKAAFVVHQPDDLKFRPGRHPYHHAGVFYSQEPSASSAAPLLGVRPGMRVLDLCAAPGGKSLVLGWDSRWGTTMQVTAPGSSSSGTYRPYGMDCSGYVDWVFYNATGGEYIIGHGGGASAQHTYCTTISWDEALPGDLVFYPEDSHVGIVGGRDESGNLLIIHCASGYNNVVITGIEGFTSIGRPVYFSD